jgi:hypothetical protein
MLKKILKLEGTQKLNVNEQKLINGGAPVWCGYCTCSVGIVVYGCGNTKSQACTSACLNS